MDWIGTLIWNVLLDFFHFVWDYFLGLPGWLMQALLGLIPADFRVEYVEPVVDMLIIADRWVPITETLALSQVFFTCWASVTTWKLLWKYTPLGYLGGG